MFCEPESASDSTSSLMDSVGDESQYLDLLLHKAPLSLILTAPWIIAWGEAGGPLITTQNTPAPSAVSTPTYTISEKPFLLFVPPSLIYKAK